MKIQTCHDRSNVQKKRLYVAAKKQVQKTSRERHHQGLCRCHDRYTKLRFASFRFDERFALPRQISPRLEKPTATNNRSSRENARWIWSATVFIGGRSTGKQSRVSYRVETMVQSLQYSKYNVIPDNVDNALPVYVLRTAITPLALRSLGQLKYIVTHRYGHAQTISFVVIGSSRKRTKFFFSSLHWLKKTDEGEKRWLKVDQVQDEAEILRLEWKHRFHVTMQQPV